MDRTFLNMDDETTAPPFAAIDPSDLPTMEAAVPTVDAAVNDPLPADLLLPAHHAEAYSQHAVIFHSEDAAPPTETLAAAPSEQPGILPLNDPQAFSPAEATVDTYQQPVALNIPVYNAAAPTETVAAPSEQQHPNRPCVEDAAMSLVSLGRVSPVDVNPSISPLPLLVHPPNEANIDTNVESAPPLKKTKTTNKYCMKPRDPKRDTSIPFKEMQRLMRVYGPIKCLRNRTPKESGKDLKQDSIKRKFYRWFPDFDSRFERTDEGWFKPKFGHEEEMQYRAEMRKKDQDELVKKRNTKRTSSKKGKEVVTTEVPHTTDVGVGIEVPVPAFPVADAAIEALPASGEAVNI